MAFSPYEINDLFFFFFFVPDAFVCFCVVLALVLKLDGPEVCPGCDRKETEHKEHVSVLLQWVSRALPGQLAGGF